MKQRTMDHPAQYEWTICNCADCRLPDEGPPRDLYQKAVPIWHSTSIEELEDYAEIDRIGYVKAFAGGMEVGLIMANLRPEWARAFYLELRRFYLLTHDAEDLETGRSTPTRFAALCRCSTPRIERSCKFRKV